MIGTPLELIFDDTPPCPTYVLKWGEMPEEVRLALCDGQSALLLNPDGTPHGVVTMDVLGDLREVLVESIRELNQTARDEALL